MTSSWPPEAVSAIAGQPLPAAPLIDPATVRSILPGFDLWDLWLVQDSVGRVATIAGGSLVMLLSAPRLDDPDARHAIARIRLMHRGSAGWSDLGNLLPDGLAPGSREWAGSAIVNAALDRVTLYFTAAGRRGETTTSFEQRLFETSATLSIVDGRPSLHNWSTPVESVAADGVIYTRDMAGGGAIGTIKAFRDPAWFRDPADGREYLLFTASLAGSTSPWNGAIGIARREQGKWLLDVPLISADGVNNELERPHIVYHRRHYYCFWSTQQKVFAQDGPTGPNGLYGMVAERIDGPWRPINGSGLVLANPPAAPIQAYSWLVLDDLSVLSFVDRPGLPAEAADVAVTRRHFAGTPATPIQLRLDHAKAMLA
ncbi:levansucrase [Sphingomonas sp. YR710]|uniref:glycoside hydrolase family 68 protein n=1 Tax=Sphingomonas sp. YR710 TaxID=1882773 RepID=UPI000889353E|nr:glycoside hydrolase family 68 protein [Sphingomonas sp. YR710]SDC53320.1 levansucrase [Sphingomonas sp. YR710]